MSDAIRPEDVPQSLLDAAQKSQFLPGEGAVESDVYLRRQLAAVLTQAREMIAGRLEAWDYADAADMVRDWPYEIGGLPRPLEDIK